MQIKPSRGKIGPRQKKILFDVWLAENTIELISDWLKTILCWYLIGWKQYCVDAWLAENSIVLISDWLAKMSEWILFMTNRHSEDTWKKLMLCESKKRMFVSVWVHVCCVFWAQSIWVHKKIGRACPSMLFNVPKVNLLENQTHLQQKKMENCAVVDILCGSFSVVCYVVFQV